MGFFKNGSPFFPFCTSEVDCDPDSVGGSELSRVPAGLLPLVLALLCSSFGGTKDEADLISFIGLEGGRAGDRFVFMGGGRGLFRGVSFPAVGCLAIPVES